MISHSTYIAPQQIEKLSKIYGNAITRIVDRMIAKMRYEGMPWHSSVAPRGYLELREAKAILSCLKYKDTMDAVRLDEMAWALKTAREAYARDTNGMQIDVFDRAADMLCIDLSGQAIPLDMQRKINNEIQLMSGMAHALPVAQAV